MSVAEPMRDDTPDVDRPPSRLFKVLFGAAMVAIAIGYTWVWQVKTERVVAVPPPVLALGGATSYISADAADSSLSQLLTASIGSIPTLTVLDSAAADSADQLLFADLEAAPAGHRLKMRRMDAAADTLLQAYSVNGATVHEAVYRRAVQLAMSLGLPRPAPATSDSTASSRP